MIGVQQSKSQAKTYFNVYTAFPHYIYPNYSFHFDLITCWSLVEFKNCLYMKHNNYPLILQRIEALMGRRVLWLPHRNGKISMHASNSKWIIWVFPKWLSLYLVNTVDRDKIWHLSFSEWNSIESTESIEFVEYYF